MLPGHTVENIQNRMKHLETISNESLGKVGMGKGQTLDYNALMERLGGGGAAAPTARAGTAPKAKARAGGVRLVGANIQRGSGRASSSVAAAATDFDP